MSTLRQKNLKTQLYFRRSSDGTFNLGGEINMGVVKNMPSLSVTGSFKE